MVDEEQRVEHTITLEYCEIAAGLGAAFQWRIEPLVTLDGQEGIQVAIQLVDAAGYPVVEDRRRVSFSLSGSGVLDDCLGIVGGSRVVELVNGRASIVILTTERTTLLVTAQGLPDTHIPIQRMAF